MDAVRVIESLNADDIASRLAEIEAERNALLVLRRAALARRRDGGRARRRDLNTHNQTGRET